MNSRLHVWCYGDDPKWNLQSDARSVSHFESERLRILQMVATTIGENRKWFLKSGDPISRKSDALPCCGEPCTSDTCSYKVPQYCSGNCGSSRHWITEVLRNLFHLPREYSAVKNEEPGADGFLRCIIFSLVGFVGGFSVLLSLAGGPVMASPAHEFVEINSEVEEAAFLSCPMRGRAAPLSLLLRYPRSFRDGSVIPLLSLDIVREGASESMVNYGQIIAARDDKSSKKDMYTGDAWMGMCRLEQYGRLTESMEEKEKLCKECVRNRRLLEQVWQTVSNDYYDHFGSFSQSQWAGELYRTLSKAGGLFHTKAETYAATKVMVTHLGDKYSSFLLPNEYRLAIHHPLPSEIKYLSY